MKNAYENIAINNSKKDRESGQAENNVDERYSLSCYAKVETIEMNNGSSLEFLGVRHTQDTLEKFGTEIRKFIDEADILLSELVVIENDEKKNDVEIFYQAITQIAKEKNKKIIVADPERKFSDALVNRALSIAPLLASVGAGAYLAKKLFEIGEKIEKENFLKKYNTDADKSEKKEAVLSRRSFLKMMAATGVAFAGGLSGIAGALEEMGLSEEKGKLLERFLLDSLDYRNALIAKEILSLSEDHKKVSVVYGAGHLLGIKKFLKDRDLLKASLEKYEKTYGLINNDKADVYDFSKPADNQHIGRENSERE